MQYINDIKSASSDLSAALKDLSGPAFSQRSMVSSNTDTLTVSYNGNNLASMGEVRVKVDQVASGQVNEGSRLSSSSSYSGDRGINRFEIETGGKTTQLSVNITAGDSNRDVQNKMATAINNAGLGLKATVEVDTATNSSMLKIESVNVGTNERNAFKITDRTGNVATVTGANDVSRERQDAIYSVNGGPSQTSQSNTINLGNGLSATLRAASDDEVSIVRGKDVSSAISSVQSMVRSFNNLFTSAVNNVADPKAQNLSSRMINISSAYSRALSEIGISFDAGGRMTVNNVKLNQAAESGRLEQFFMENRGKNFGFSAMMGKLSDNVSTNTSSFVSNSAFGNSVNEGVSYSGLGNLLSFSSMKSASIMDFLL